MTNTITITNSSGVTFTFNPGDVITINSEIGTELDFDAMPLSPPSDALLFDFSGVTKRIIIDGKLSLATSTRTSSGTTLTVDDQRKWLEINLDGGQGGATFVSDHTSTYNGSSWVDSKILFSTIRFQQIFGEPNALTFNITLFVGDV